jgi:tRNA pseudouridine13 synthase
MNVFDYTTPPLLTASLPGIGGVIRQQPEDFQVEEIPSYEPSGEGEHLFLWIEKRSTGADHLFKHIAKALQMERRDIGCAGLKDRHAITRQYISVPAKLADRVDAINCPEVQVLSAKKHNNKLRTGHQKGNRFIITVRQVEEAALVHLPAIIEQLQKQGLPNYYGEQRFGRSNETLNIGRQLLAREVVKVPPFLKKLSLSSVQSVLFNAVLGRRLEEKLLHTVIPGDVMQKQPFGGLFVAEEFPREQERMNAGETSPTGPMFGTKMFTPKLEALAREQAVLAESGYTLETFAGFGDLLEGTRRPNLVNMKNLAITTEPGTVGLKFDLPSGSYATVLLREIMKAEIAEPEEREYAEKG